MSKLHLVPLLFIVTFVFAPTAQSQTYFGEAVFPDVDYEETFFPTDPDGSGQLTVTCAGTSSVRFSDMVVDLSLPSMSFNFETQATNVTGTDARFCVDAQNSFPFPVANVAVSESGIIGQNSSGSLTIELLFSANRSRLEGTVTSIGAFPGQEIGQANLTLADRYQINATGTSEDRGGGLVTTSDWVLVFEDRNNDGLLQVDETVSFSGATVTTSLGTFVYDAVVGSPAIIGISGLSGEFGECCWWFTGPTTADPEDGWFSDRWTYELTNLSIPDAGILLEELDAAVTGIGPGNSLADKIMLAQTYLAVPDLQSACAVLNAFLNQVRAQRGKKLTDEQANQFTADAEAIIAAIGCD